MRVDVVDDRQHVRRRRPGRLLHVKRAARVVPTHVVIDRGDRNGLAATAAKRSSDWASSTATVNEVTWSPSRSKSSTPVTVTVWREFQFAGVNVKTAGLTAASPVSPLVTINTTCVAGCAVSTAVNEVVPPASVTVKPLVGLTVIPAVSLSTL